jgi:glycine C-acetyltransferase
MRSQTFAKALPMPMVMGLKKRFELLKSKPELREKLWEIANACKTVWLSMAFDIGITDTMVTPVFLKGELTGSYQPLWICASVYSIFCSIVVYPVIPKGSH